MHGGGEGWLQGAAESGVVGGGDHVEGGPHHGGPQDLAGLQEVNQLFAAEVAEAGPEADEGRAGLLGLQSGEALDEFERRYPGQRAGFEQELAREKGAVECLAGQRCGHKLQYFALCYSGSFSG